jgi:hypothetical protein
MLSQAWRALFLFVLDFYRFKVLSFEDLAAIETLDVVHSVSPGDDLGTVMLTGGLHKTTLR